MGNPPNNLPPPPEPDPQFQQADVVNDVKRDWKEKLFGALTGGRGGQLDNAIQQHHQARLDEARMNRRNASTAQAQIFYLNKYGINPETYEDLNDPNYKGESKEDLLRKYNNQYLASMNNYTKIAGVNPETKQAINKARQIVEYLSNQGQLPGQQGGTGQAPSAAPTQQYPTNVSDTGVSYIPPDQRPGAMPAPPTPNYPTTVSDAGVSFKAPPTPTGGGATSMVPPEAAYTDANGVYHPSLKHRSAAEIENASAPAPAPAAPQAAKGPAPDLTNFPEQAPFIRGDFKAQQALGQGLQKLQATYEQQHAMWRKEADQLFDKGSKEWKWYAATGTLPRQFGLQAKDIEFKDETGIHRVKANYDPTTGQFEYGGKIIDNAQIADKPQLIKYVKTDQTGRPHLIGGFMLGTQLYDQQMNPLPPNTEFYSRGLFGTDTLHQQITIGPNGEPMINTLERVTTPTYQKAIWGDEQAPPAAGGAEQPIAHGPASPTPPVSKGGATPPPVAQGKTAPKNSSQARPPMHGQNVDARGRPLGLPSRQFTVQSKGATGVDQARNSLVGDDIEKGQVGGLAKDMDVFKSKDSMKRIGEYLQLVHNQAANEGDSFAHAGDTIGAVKWFAGLPQLNIALQQGALRDQYDQLTTDEKKFVADYFRVMGTMGGMRASTGMPGYQWAFTNMYNEMPTPGKVNDYEDAVRRLMNYVKETNVVSKRNSLLGKIDVDDAEKQIRGGKSGGRQVATPPPNAPIKDAAGLLNKYGIQTKQP